MTDTDLGLIEEFGWRTGTGLRGSGITGLQAGDFQGLSSLKELDLLSNDLTRLPVGIFSGLSSLEELDLSSNDLTGLPAGIFSGLSSLKELDLHGNDLTALQAGDFQGLPNLEELSLSFNDLTGLPGGDFQGLSSLKGLDLSSNDLAELPVGLFEGLQSLRELYLAHNPGAPFIYEGEKLEDESGIIYLDLYGDMPETATLLEYGRNYSDMAGMVYPNNDFDYFRVEVTEENSGYLDFRLYDFERRTDGSGRLGNPIRKGWARVWRKGSRARGRHIFLRWAPAATATSQAY